MEDIVINPVIKTSPAKLDDALMLEDAVITDDEEYEEYDVMMCHIQFIQFSKARRL
ncbi:MAG: hypothetical protein Ta2D_11310 [Rickettsiales bacterium]|nr:MAG: hypothetical protein Ta2D_11310 [Rickettsiales bacterium]